MESRCKAPVSLQGSIRLNVPLTSFAKFLSTVGTGNGAGDRAGDRGGRGALATAEVWITEPIASFWIKSEPEETKGDIRSTA